MYFPNFTCGKTDDGRKTIIATITEPVEFFQVCKVLVQVEFPEEITVLDGMDAVLLIKKAFELALKKLID